MAFELGKGFLSFGLDDAAMERGLNKTFRTVDRFNKKMGASFTRLAKVTAGVVAAGFALSIKLATQQAKAEAKLGSVLETTNHAAGFRLDELKEFASEMQELLAVSDDLIIDTMGILGSFVEITGDNFKWATEMVFNLAELMGTDAKSAAVQLGKALNDPIKGLTSLSRSGVSFSESTKQVIKDMVAMGDVAGAQTVILQEMADQGLGGLARAAADTQPLVKLKNTLADILEGFGAEMLEPIEELTDALQGLLKDNSFKRLGSYIAGLVTELIKLRELGADSNVAQNVGANLAEAQVGKIPKAPDPGTPEFGVGRLGADPRVVAAALRFFLGGDVEATGKAAVERGRLLKQLAQAMDERTFQDKINKEVAERESQAFEDSMKKFDSAILEMRKALLSDAEREKELRDAKDLDGKQSEMDKLITDIMTKGVSPDGKTEMEQVLEAQIKALQESTQSPQNLFQSLDAVADMFSTTSENEQQKQLDVLQKQLKEETEQRKLQARIAEAVENPPPPRLGV